MNRANLAGQLETVRGIRARIERDTTMLDSLEQALQSQVRSGVSTGDPIADILYHYGLPYKLKHFEDNLRAIDAKLRSCANEFVLLEVIQRNGDHSNAIGLLPASYTSNQQPLRSMRYLGKEGVAPGIQINARGTDPIILSSDIVNQFKNGPLPERRGLLDQSHSFRLVIGFEEMEKHLMRDCSQTLTETSAQRASRMKQLARMLSSLRKQHSIIVCNTYPELTRIALESEKD